MVTGIGKILIAVSLFSFLAVGGLLFSGHGGFAIKITNYIFWVLLAGILYEIIKK